MPDPTPRPWYYHVIAAAIMPFVLLIIWIFMVSVAVITPVAAWWIVRKETKKHGK